MLETYAMFKYSLKFTPPEGNNKNDRMEHCELDIYDWKLLSLAKIDVHNFLMITACYTFKYRLRLWRPDGSIDKGGLNAR